jgi:predicted neuraminidase
MAHEAVVNSSVATNVDRRSPAALRSGRLTVRQRVVLIVATLALGFVAARQAPRAMVTAPTSSGAAERPIGAGRSAGPAVAPKPHFAESWVSPHGHVRSTHGSAICALPSGDMLAVWYGGTREGAADVALFTSRLVAGTAAWTAPERAVDRVIAQEELDRVIKKVGNAVIFPDASGTLWMVYVSVSMGGWSGSSLNVKTSQDEGRTWGPSRRLTLNPFLNLSTLVRNKPIYTSDGRIGLPVYHELAIKFPQILWLTPGPNGSVQDYRMRNFASETGLIQPSLVPLGHDRVLMMLRDRRPDKRMHTAYSDDNGWTWSEAAASDLPNPDSALDALRLNDGRIVLVYNHAHRGRENLRLAVSADAGRTWQAGPVLEATAGREYSYPFLVEDRAGGIHLTYTWHRERIKHLRFNLAWLDEALRSNRAGQQ